MSIADEQNSSETNSSPIEKAIVLDLGKKKRKDIRRLRKGGGKLLDQIEDHLDELRAAGVLDESAQPVIVVVAEKQRKLPWL